MSKELEALNELSYRLASVDTSNTIEEAHDDVFPIIRKALTPPTSDEVCEALNKWYVDITDDLLIATINDFTYDKDKKRFYKRMLNQPYQMTMCRLDTNDCVQLREPLPPRLITLIGRFYEGVGK